MLSSCCICIRIVLSFQITFLLFYIRLSNGWLIKLQCEKCSEFLSILLNIPFLVEYYISTYGILYIYLLNIIYIPIEYYVSTYWILYIFQHRHYYYYYYYYYWRPSTSSTMDDKHQAAKNVTSNYVLFYMSYKEQEIIIIPRTLVLLLSFCVA
jgi:hypothetical protein